MVGSVRERPAIAANPSACRAALVINVIDLALEAELVKLHEELGILAAEVEVRRIRMTVIRRRLVDLEDRAEVRRIDRILGLA